MSEVAVSTRDPAPSEEATIHRWPEALPAMLVALGGSAIVLGYWRLVRFSTYTSDPANYWSDSVHWRDPYNNYHLPGYPLILAIGRGLTVGLIPRGGLMPGITVGALLVGVQATYTLAREVELSRRVSLFAATMFGVWPFVGAVYAAFAVSDPVALAALLWGAIFLLRRRGVAAGLALGVVAITHKGLWPAIGLLVIGQLLIATRRRTAITIATIAAAPLVLLWLDGIASAHGTGWLLSASAEDAARPMRQGSFPLLDGLVGSALYGDSVERVRVAVVVAIATLAVVVVCLHLRRWREQVHLIALVFAAQIIFMALTLNQHLIWASVRFSGLLAVPAAWAAAPAIDRCPRRRWRLATSLVAAVLAVTQLLTAAEGARRGWAGTL